MKLVVASDEQTSLTDAAVAHLRNQGHELQLLGHLASEDQKWHWADIGKAAAKKIATGEAEYGILFCASGTGICIAANKIKGTRAALCWNADIAAMARQWNDANIICMSLEQTTPPNAIEMLDTWFSTPFNEEGLNQAHTVDN